MARARSRSRRAPAGSPAARTQACLGHQRLGELVPRAHLFERPNGRLEVRGGGGRVVGGQDLAEEPLGHALEVAVAELPAGGQDLAPAIARARRPLARLAVALDEPEAPGASA